MSTDIQRTKMEITADPRLRSGVRAALEHICERHGLSKADRRELVASVEDECASGTRSSGANCAVTIDEMDDRVEVAVTSTKKSSGKINSRGTNAAQQQSASRAKANGGPGRIFVKHFQKNAAHS